MILTSYHHNYIDIPYTLACIHCKQLRIVCIHVDMVFDVCHAPGQQLLLHKHEMIDFSQPGAMSSDC